MSNRFKNLVNDDISSKKEQKLHVNSRWKKDDAEDTSNRFKFSGRNSSYTRKKDEKEEPKLALNSRWKRTDDEIKDDEPKIGVDNDRRDRRENRGSRYDDRNIRDGDRNMRGGDRNMRDGDRNIRDGDRNMRGGDRNMRGGGSGGARYGDRNNRNNFNRKYKAGYKRTEGPVPCTADRFGINFSNLEKFKKIEKNPKREKEKKKVIITEEITPGLSKDEIATTLALAEQYQYQTESDEEFDDEDAESVDSMENWKPNHI